MPPACPPRSVAATRLAALIALLLLSCATPRAIERPAPESLHASAVERASAETHIRAAVLDAPQSTALLRVHAAERDLIAVLFAVTNTAGEPVPLAQNDFRLRLNDARRVAPALPGRAASLLRDRTASDQALWAGVLVFGALAAPSIDSAQRREEYAVRTSRELIFSSATLAPGSTVTGYLIFESPLPLDDVVALVLEVRESCGTALELPLALPASAPPPPRGGKPYETRRARIVESDVPTPGVRDR